MGIISDPDPDSDPETDLSACEHAQADKSQQQQFPRIRSYEFMFILTQLMGITPSPTEEPLTWKLDIPCHALRDKFVTCPARQGLDIQFNSAPKRALCSASSFAAGLLAESDEKGVEFVEKDGIPREPIHEYVPKFIIINGFCRSIMSRHYSFRIGVNHESRKMKRI